MKNFYDREIAKLLEGASIDTNKVQHTIRLSNDVSEKLDKYTNKSKMIELVLQRYFDEIAK